MSRHWSLVLGLFCHGSLVLGHWSFAAEVGSPLEPDESQNLFQLADESLRIELAAAEPQVVDPIAIRFDEHGRMWVAEMRDYPQGPPKGSDAHSRIQVLEDRDGDGRYETATTFADKLSFVTGIQPWKEGVFVTLAGRVTYMKDTDGDGRADLDETWFEGFAQQNTQLRANHPRLAIDNWIYVANGLRGGKVVNRRFKDQAPIDISGMDFRFNPLTGEAEAVSGNGQFGLCFDDWGNRFTCSNRNPCRHAVIEDRYLRANPSVTVPAVMHDVAKAGEESRIFPISRAWTTSNLHAGQFTAACGVYIYRGDLLPAEFKGNVFTCDPTGNLVHREIMQPAGPTFTSTPAYEGKEFLASPDEWFRPVNLELGPDGALYVVDMYRAVIEHPDFVPDELKKRPDQRLGDDRGRIWRIVPKDTSPQRKQGKWTLPARESHEAQLDLLSHSNAWQRETAQRLLLEADWTPEHDAAASKAFSERNVETRRHLLFLLEQRGQAKQETLRRAISDENPRLRALAVRLLANHPETAERAKLLKRMINDEDARLRFEVRLHITPSLSGIDLAEWIGNERTRKITLADSNDLWQRAALRIALGPEGAVRFVSRWLGEPLERLPTESELSLATELCELSMAVRDSTHRRLAMDAAFRARHNQQLETAAWQGIARGLTRRSLTVAGDVEQPFATRLQEPFHRVIRDRSADGKLRTAAIEILAAFPASPDVLLPLIDRQEDQSVRIAAIAALTRVGAANHWPPLIDGFASDTPAVRKAIIDSLLSSSERTALLLTAIEGGKIKPGELDPAHATRLNQHRDPAIRERAAKLFAAATPAERAKALADYQPALSMQADPRRGQVVFEKNCAACHRIGGLGVNVAPDISDSRTKTAAQILTDILQPNRAIDNNYIGYAVRLIDGTVATGILSAETGTSITLRQQGGKELVVPRSEIEELRSSGLSLMPEGLERQIPLQDMADLVSFIKNWRYLDGRTPVEAIPMQP